MLDNVLNHIQSKRGNQKKTRKKKIKKKIVKSQQEENEKTKRNKIQLTERHIDVFKAGFESAEQSIIEGNNAFAELLKSRSLDRKKIVCVQNNIDMGVKREIELNKEIFEVEHEKSKLEK